eukprot:99891-Rhodomonas_salina.2
MQAKEALPQLWQLMDTTGVVDRELLPYLWPQHVQHLSELEVQPSFSHGPPPTPSVHPANASPSLPLPKLLLLFRWPRPVRGMRLGRAWAWQRGI